MIYTLRKYLLFILLITILWFDFWLLKGQLDPSKYNFSFIVTYHEKKINSRFLGYIWGEFSPLEGSTHLHFETKGFQEVPRLECWAAATAI